MIYLGMATAVVMLFFVGFLLFEFLFVEDDDDSLGGW